MLKPEFTGAVHAEAGVGKLLHALVTHFGQPQLDGLGLGAGDGLDDTQQALCGGDIGEALLAVCGR